MPRSGKREWHLQLIDGRTGKPIDDDAGQVAAIIVGSGRKATLYSDDNGTSQSQPMTFTDGKIRFFTDDTVTALDLVGITGNGHGFFIESLDENQHRYVVWPEADRSLFALPYELNATVTGSVVDSGFDLPTNVMVDDAYLDVLEVATGGALSVGTSASVSGFLLAAICTVVATGLNFLSQALTSYGALLNATATGRSLAIRYRGTSLSGRRLVYSNVTSSSTAGSGFVYFKLQRLPSR